MTGRSLIDWALVGYSTLWIVGLSLILALLSWADYQAAQQKIHVREALRGASYQFFLNLGLGLVCLGWVGSARLAWERLVWAGLAVAFVSQVWRSWRAWRHPSEER